MDPINLNSDQAVNPQSLRDALRFWTTGVSIVAAAHQGQRHGMTVNSFASISLEPPLVLVSLEKSTRTHDLVTAAGAYAVSILGQGHQALSDRFAGRETEESDRFLGIETVEGPSGSPVLADALAAFDCRLDSTYDAGTHSLLIGRVVALAQRDGQEPLLYFNRDYRRLAG